MHFLKSLMMLAFLLLLLPAKSFSHDASQRSVKVGDKFLLIERYETSSESDDGSSGKSSGGGALTEEILEIREDGWVVRYGLPDDASEQQRLRQWQFPAKIFKSSDGDWQILNEEMIIGRRDAWLSQSEIPKEACGSYYFTWNVFKIECDLHSAISIARSYDDGFCDFRSRSSIDLPLAAMPVSLKVRENGLGGFSLIGKAPVDANFIIQGNAESDVAVAQINGDKLSYADALAEQQKGKVSGDVNITIFVGSNGCLKKKITVSEIATIDANGVSETRKVINTLTREKITPSDG